jgi:hypothetical protein
MAIQARVAPTSKPSDKQVAWLFKIYRRMGGKLK